jgi:16S rRNA (cytidine1402-2'-O)-methyltransferase
MTAVLYAIPTPLGASPQDSLPAPVLRTVRALRDFAVENAKSARAFLAAAGCDPKELRVRELGDETDLGPLLAPLRAGRALGLLAEAGCPALADPGARLVEAAHREGYRVVPMVGPSAIVLALLASGLGGQRFAFCGYLPREARARARRIRALEHRSRAGRETQIFIETPYRSDALLAALLDRCAPATRLCVATDLTLPTESVRTQTIAAWRTARPPIGRRPTVFVLLA